MNKQDTIFQLIPKVQHYAWGGTEFIPALLNTENKEQKPFAELWIGAHPACCAEIVTPSEKLNLNTAIAEQKDFLLGSAVAKTFSELPYLLKVLDVKQMLSIQVHPSKTEAEKGFDAEEKAGIAINDAKRNYKDRNHKPEVMIALSDFWLLHGFKKENELIATLENYEPFFELLPIFKRHGYKGLYEYVMTMPQAEADHILKPVVQYELQQKAAGKLSRNDAGWWVCKLFESGTDNLNNIDRGIFSIYFFNVLHLKKGEAIFQAAGVPHAYLEGQNVELMASSDNVLRGGLTNKHIDVPELIKHTRFEAAVPGFVHPIQAHGGKELLFLCPVKDFSISSIHLAEGESYTAKTASFETLLVMEGTVKVGNLQLGKGQVFAVAADSDYTIQATESSVLFKAFVPV